MDPLSVTSAIVGLIAAGAKIFSLLEALSSIKDSPATIKDAKNELRHTEIAMRALQRLFDRLQSETSSTRREMIQIDDLRIMLADAMLEFSEFESLLELLGRLAKFRVAIAWSKYSKKLEEHLERLQRQKLSLTLMLNILQCDTVDEAYRCQERLHDLLDRILNENAGLKEKLRISEDTFDALSVVTRRPNDDSATVRHPESVRGDDTSTIRGGTTLNRNSTVRRSMFEHSAGAIKFAFENILEKSWVYRRNKDHQECDRSFASSAVRSRAWSIFSEYTLGDISVLSVIAMPIKTMHLTNGHHYIDQQRSSTEPNNTQPPANTRVDGPDIDSDSGINFSYPYHPERKETSSSSGIVSSTKTDDAAFASDALSSSIMKIYFDVNSNDDDIPFHGNHAHGEPEVDWSCKGCGEILEEGKVFEMAGHRWHLDCFRCGTCSTLLDSDATLLLLGDGTLVCNNCTYDCSACGEKIEDLAILTQDGEQAFCPSCFSCRNCKRKIKDLRYARTSQGIFCMECHESLMARRRRKMKSRMELL